jgi:hypothetical protein
LLPYHVTVQRSDQGFDSLKDSGDRKVKALFTSSILAVSIIQAAASAENTPSSVCQINAARTSGSLCKADADDTVTGTCKLPKHPNKVMVQEALATLSARSAAESAEGLGLREQQTRTLLKGCVNYDGTPRIAEFEEALRHEPGVP